MDNSSAIFEAITNAYGLARSSPAQQVSERVWRWPQEEGDVAVKIYAQQHGERAQTEAAVLAHLQAPNPTHYRVQKLKLTLKNDAIWSGFGAHVVVTNWAQGEFKTYDTFTPEEWFKLGSSLAALHQGLNALPLPELSTLKDRLEAIDAEQVRASLTLLADRASREGAPPGLLDYTYACLGLLETHYPRSLSAFPEDSPQLPIHNDYNQHNYLFDGQLPPIILDWEATIAAPREYELVRCLNHLPLEAPELARYFIQGYTQIQPVSTDHIAWAVDAACLQHAIKRWVWDGWMREPQKFEAQLQGSMKMAFAIRGARRHLIDFYTECIEMDGPQQSH